jgi:hypothetical protein
MGTDDLTPKEAALLVLLLAENRDLTNTELAEDFGFKLDKKNRDKLNRLGLIESTKDGGKPFVHQLTDAGWARCYQPLNLESSRARAQGAALSALLQAVLRHLDQQGLSLAEFATTATEPAAPAADLGARVRDAYGHLASGPGVYVGLVELRQELADVGRDELDDTLRSLERETDVGIVPESNQKVLTTADRDAALWIGGEHKHYLVIGT